MPVYEYEDLRTGRRVELVRPVNRRDQVEPHLKRVAVPRSVAVVGARLDPESAAAAVPKAFRELEDTVSAAQIERQSGFTREEIKRVWDF